ncbi:MAG: PadR family transcriptional regulator [Candidatus Methanomethylicia archaeon]|nr:PadR family transcriptional regulator [Candidatus Methanomethylicia archaeon]
MHGGGIHQSLKERFGIDTAKPIVYVMLRRMEEAGLVVSQWDTSGSGPAKRVYRITQDGIDYLKDAIDNLKNVVKLIRMLISEEGSSDV